MFARFRGGVAERTSGLMDEVCATGEWSSDDRPWRTGSSICEPAACGGAGRGDVMLEMATGARGAGRAGVRLAIDDGGGDDVGEVTEDAERGIGGGALGFSKLS